MFSYLLIWFPLFESAHSVPLLLVAAGHDHHYHQNAEEPEAPEPGEPDRGFPTEEEAPPRLRVL